MREGRVLSADQRFALRLEGVSKWFETKSGEVHALDDVSVSIPKGKFVAIVGESGCGKSTLLKIAAGLIQPDDGRAIVCDKPPRAGRRDVGIMLQTPALLPWRTVRENVLLPFTIFGRREKSQDDRAEKVLEVVGLDAFANSYPWQLSGGMQQRAALARLLVFQPDLQLLDEPFGALDELTRERLNLEVARIFELGHQSGVVLVTHSVQEAILLADIVVVLSARPGRVAGEVEVPLERPRRAEMVEDPEFVSTSRKVRQLLGLEESHRAVAS